MPCCSKSLDSTKNISKNIHKADFGSTSALPGHAVAHSSGRTHASDQEVQRFKCHSCPCSFKNFYDMFQHRKSHNEGKFFRPLNFFSLSLSPQIFQSQRKKLRAKIAAQRPRKPHHRCMKTCKTSKRSIQLVKLKPSCQ